MAEQIATKVGPAKIDICYERLGDEDAPPVLLVMGLLAQLIHWPDGFCDELVSRGLQVIRFDNRDAGRSTHFSDGPQPDFAAAMAGDASSAVYTLSDMAADAVGLLDVLALPSAHLVGMSLGGRIAQTIAIEHPTRVRTLTSISATTDAPGVGQPRPEGMRALAAPPATTREEIIERSVAAARLVGSPGFPSDDDEVRSRAARAYDRDHDPGAAVRQGVATIASGDRTQALRKLDLPTLVIHGADDVVCDVSGGRATAEAIPGAELVVIDGMGHDLPRALWPRIAGLIEGLVKRVES